MLGYSKYIIVLVVLFFTSVNAFAFADSDGPMSYADAPDTFSDAGSFISPRHANKMTFTNMTRNVDTRVTYDMGAANYPGDFTHYLRVKITATGVNGDQAIVWGVSTIDGNYATIKDDGGEHGLFLFFSQGEGVQKMFMVEVDDGATYNSALTGDGQAHWVFALNTEYSIKIDKVSGVIKVYTSIDYGDTWTDRITLTQTGVESFRWLHALNSNNSGAANTISGYVQNLNSDATVANIAGVTDSTTAFGYPPQGNAFEQTHYAILYKAANDGGNGAMFSALADLDDGVFREPRRVENASLMKAALNGYDWDTSFSLNWQNLFYVSLCDKPADVGWSFAAWHKPIETHHLNMALCLKDSTSAGLTYMYHDVTDDYATPGVVNDSRDWFWLVANYTTGTDHYIQARTFNRFGEFTDILEPFTIKTLTAADDGMGKPVASWTPEKAWADWGIVYTNVDSLYYVHMDGDTQFGQHTGGDAEADLTDSTKNGVWSDGDFEGQIIYNITQGKSDTINAGETDQSNGGDAHIHTGFGAGDEWDTDDIYIIIGSEETIATSDLQTSHAFAAGVMQNNVLLVVWKDGDDDFSCATRPMTDGASWTLPAGDADYDAFVTDASTANDLFSLSIDVGENDHAYLFYADVDGGADTDINRIFLDQSTNAWAGNTQVATSITLQGTQIKTPQYIYNNCPLFYIDEGSDRVTMTDGVSITPSGVGDEGIELSSMGSPTESTRTVGNKYGAYYNGRTFFIWLGNNGIWQSQFHSNGSMEGSPVEFGGWHADLAARPLLAVDKSDGTLYIKYGGRHSGHPTTVEQAVRILRSNVSLDNIATDCDFTDGEANCFDDITPDTVEDFDDGSNYGSAAIDEASTFHFLRKEYPPVAGVDKRIYISGFWPSRHGVGDCNIQSDPDACWNGKTALYSSNAAGCGTGGENWNIYPQGMVIGNEVANQTLHLTWIVRDGDVAAGLAGSYYAYLNYLHIIPPAFGGNYTAKDANGDDYDGVDHSALPIDCDEEAEWDDMFSFPNDADYISWGAFPYLTDEATDRPGAVFLQKDGTTKLYESLRAAKWTGAAWTKYNIEADVSGELPFRGWPTVTMDDDGQIWVALVKETGGTFQIGYYIDNETDGVTWDAWQQLTSGSYDCAFPVLVPQTGTSYVHIMFHHPFSQLGSTARVYNFDLSAPISGGVFRGIREGIATGILY